MKKTFFLMLYYLFCQHLPSSFFPLGSFFNFCRTFVLKRIVNIGNNNKVQNNVYIGKGDNIQIGSSCQINARVKLDNVVISNYVMIAPGVTVLGKMHKFSRIDIPMINQGARNTVEPTIIEDDVWIGTNAVIMPGVTLGKGSIIGAGAVVTKNTEPYGIYGGIPAKVIRYRK